MHLLDTTDFTAQFIIHAKSMLITETKLNHTTADKMWLKSPFPCYGLAIMQSDY